MDKFEVEFYAKDNGEKPVKDFILGLDVKTRETPNQEIKLAKLYVKTIWREWEEMSEFQVFLKEQMLLPKKNLQKGRGLTRQT